MNLTMPIHWISNVYKTIDPSVVICGGDVTRDSIIRHFPQWACQPGANIRMAVDYGFVGKQLMWIDNPAPNWYIVNIQPCPWLIAHRGISLALAGLAMGQFTGIKNQMAELTEMNVTPEIDALAVFLETGPFEVSVSAKHTPSTDGYRFSGSIETERWYLANADKVLMLRDLIRYNVIGKV